ncbi:hypothetical protein TNIN_353371 [Trichonephila inaurata madagascariensis]|uniref:Uncharacterized protein n=1 Tax=Trichonephila inaurata madagascariensis TaxID=2747483 RepID=A0A8X6X693_9ARAC|nr:hypothetical protein TNIN_353371 [Trichonephila inaurata madagascariensis]
MGTSKSERVSLLRTVGLRYGEKSFVVGLLNDSNHKTVVAAIPLIVPSVSEVDREPKKRLMKVFHKRKQLAYRRNRVVWSNFPDQQLKIVCKGRTEAVRNRLSEVLRTGSMFECGQKRQQDVPLLSLG